MRVPCSETMRDLTEVLGSPKPQTLPYGAIENLREASGSPFHDSFISGSPPQILTGMAWEEAQDSR